MGEGVFVDLEEQPIYIIVYIAKFNAQTNKTEQNKFH